MMTDDITGNPVLWSGWAGLIPGRLQTTIFFAESMQRNYLLTGEVAFKKEYARLADRVDADTVELARLVADEPRQIASLIR